MRRTPWGLIGLLVATGIVAAFHVSLTPLRVAPNFHDAIIDPNIEHGIWYAAAYVFRLMTEGTGLTVSPPVLFFYILSGFVLTASLIFGTSQPGR